MVWNATDWILAAAAGAAAGVAPIGLFLTFAFWGSLPQRFTRNGSLSLFLAGYTWPAVTRLLLEALLPMLAFMLASWFSPERNVAYFAAFATLLSFYAPFKDKAPTSAMPLLGATFVFSPLAGFLACGAWFALFVALRRVGFSTFLTGAMLPLIVLIAQPDTLNAAWGLLFGAVAMARHRQALLTPLKHQPRVESFWSQWI